MQGNEYDSRSSYGLEWEEERTGENHSVCVCVFYSHTNNVGAHVQQYHNNASKQIAR